MTIAMRERKHNGSDHHRKIMEKCNLIDFTSRGIEVDELLQMPHSATRPTQPDQRNQTQRNQPSTTRPNAEPIQHIQRRTNPAQPTQPNHPPMTKTL